MFLSAFQMEYDHCFSLKDRKLLMSSSELSKVRRRDDSTKTPCRADPSVKMPTSSTPMH